ncbi:MAG: DUF2293 domain-containing protein [Bryobacterales bacterium]|nr:DUF2293 domain-containing protein [Bryobacterales bacterium]
MKKVKPDLEQRVVRAAEAALAARSFVSPIDVFTGIGWLSPGQVESWRRGRSEFLLADTQIRPESLTSALRILREWAESNELRACETRYRRLSRGQEQSLYFISTGGEWERVLRTHFLSVDLSMEQQRKLQEKVETPKESVAFFTRHGASCSECGVELSSGGLLTMDGSQPLCLACGGLADLVFLQSGDAALTRRAGKYSARRAVVVEFSRSRGRYERQGMLVEEAALAKAEAECCADAPDRARARAAAATARLKEDERFVLRFAGRIRELYPGCPEGKARQIASHTASRGSGRVGRSAAGRELRQEAVELAVRAAVRHADTPYDEWLAGGMDREQARHRVSSLVEDLMRSWLAK